jgi:uncharacterized membrane protein
MDLKRIARHLFAIPAQVARAFPPATMAAIERTIREQETRHAGEIRFAVEAALEVVPLLRGQSARERAIEVFSQLRVWDTEHNNGILIYLLLADRNVEIIADRGIDAKVDPDEWELICRDMEGLLAQGHYEHAAIAGIKGVARHLSEHFLPRAVEANELPDKPVVL